MDMIADAPSPMNAPAPPDGSKTLFCAYVIRSLRAALAAAPEQSKPLSDALSARYSAVLGFALRMPEAWPEVCTLLRNIAMPVLLSGTCEGWAEVFKTAMQLATQREETATAAWLHLELGRQLLLTERTPDAQAHFEQARHFAEQAGDRAILFRATERLAFVHIVCGQFDTARTLATGALPLAPPGGVDRALLYHTLGYLAAQETEYTTAIERYSTALHLREAAGATLAAAKTLRDIGVVYACMEDYERAKTALDGALAEFARFDDQHDWAITLMDLGVVFLELGVPAQSLACLDCAEPVFVAMRSGCQLARLYNNRGRTQQALGLHDNAVKSLEVSLNWGRSDGATYEVANSLDSLAIIYLQQQETALAIATWRAALDELHKLNGPAGYLENRIRQALEAATTAL